MVKKWKSDVFWKMYRDNFLTTFCHFLTRFCHNFSSFFIGLPSNRAKVTILFQSLKFHGVKKRLNTSCQFFSKNVKNHQKMHFLSLFSHKMIFRARFDVIKISWQFSLGLNRHMKIQLWSNLRHPKFCHFFGFCHQIGRNILDTIFRIVSFHHFSLFFMFFKNLMFFDTLSKSKNGQGKVRSRHVTKRAKVDTILENASLA